MLDAVLLNNVEKVKAELTVLITAENVSADQLQEKADTLHALLTIDSPNQSSLAYQTFLRENLQWLQDTIEQVSILKNQLGVELMQLSKRRKADKIYGENT